MMQQIDDKDGHEGQFKQIELTFSDKLRGLFSSGPFKKGEFMVINEN